MEPVPVGTGLFHQVGADQHVQGLARFADGDVGEQRGGLTVEIRARVQAQQPEQPRGGLREHTVGPAEDGPDRVRLLVVIGGQRVPQRRFVAKVADEFAQGHVGPAHRPFRRDAQGQGQAPAQAGEFGDLVVGVAGPVAVGHPAEEVHRLGGAEGAHGQAPRPLVGDEPGEAVSAGHQDHRGGGPGQQGADLGGGGRVVQNDQDAAVGQQGPVQGRPALRVRGHRVTGYPQGAQEAVQDLPRIGRRRDPVPAQVHVKLPSGEPVAHQVGPVQGERGLADPGGAGDEVDGRALWAVLVQESVEGFQFADPVHEPVDVGGQLPGAGAWAGEVS